MTGIRRLLSILAYASALVGFLPLWPYLQPLARLIFIVGLGGGIACERSRRALPSWLVTAGSVLIFLFYLLQVGRNNLVGPVVNLLVVLLAVRLLSRKAPRDLLQIFALSLLCLASSSLYTLDAIFIVYLLLHFFMIPLSLVLLTFYSTGEDMPLAMGTLGRIVRFSTLIPLAALPLIVIFFMILPRTPLPLWNALAGASPATSGYTEKVEPGSSPAVTVTKQVAFRAASPQLARDELYWRATVLNTYSGKAWVRGKVPPGESSAIGKGRIVQQTIYPEPGRTALVYGLNLPRQVIGGRYSVSGDLVYSRRFSGTARFRYDVFSALHAPLIPKSGIDRDFYLELEGKFSPRMKLLADEIRSVPDERGRLNRLAELFTGLSLKYATTDLPQGEDPLTEFLFVKKQGHCEFFASAAGILLRMAGIPARLVGGYHGGTYNEYGGFYLVTEDMAHVWVEAYISGMGWVSIDPTLWAANYAATEESRERGLATILLTYLDAGSYYWNLTVINYDLESQLRIFTQAESLVRSPNWLAKAPKKSIFTIIIFFAALILLFRNRRIFSVTWEGVLLFLFRQRLRGVYGYELTGSTGLHEATARLRDPNVTRFVDKYCSILYHDRKIAAIHFRELLGIIIRIGK
jgi:hypothetical protein